MEFKRFRKTIIALLTPLVLSTNIFSAWKDPEWVHPKAVSLKIKYPGPFVVLDNGNLLRINGGQVIVSDDNGVSWTKQAKIYEGVGPGVPKSGLTVRGINGVIVFAYEDRDNLIRKWNKKTKEFSKDSRRDIWVVRSLDDGKTWGDRQRVFSGYGAAFTNIFQSSSGSFILPVQGVIVPERNRHSMFSYASFDSGKTWQRSNVIDLGGTGHHEGAFEGTVSELSDGRLWMLIRTNLDQFWSAYSSDGGRFWRRIEPSGIEASSSPGYLLRLKSGRLVLVWNRLYPENESTTTRLKADGQKTTFPASYHRSELSLAISEDDGGTWGEPRVIARTKSKKGIAYPDVIERNPGEIWITTRYPRETRLRISFKESDLLSD